MPNILVYFVLPVFIVQVAYSTSNININNNGVSDEFEKIKNEVAVDTRMVRKSPNGQPISLIFLVDIQDPLRSRWKQIRDDIRALVKFFNAYDRDLVDEYIFLQPGFYGGQ